LAVEGPGKDALTSPIGVQPVSPEESKDFERAVSTARERIQDLSALLVAANDLDQQADVILDDEGNRVS
jgi:hypothetical protein